MLTDSELRHIIAVIKGKFSDNHGQGDFLCSGWPREVIDSESLNKVLSSLDGEWWHHSENGKLGAFTLSLVANM